LTAYCTIDECTSEATWYYVTSWQQKIYLCESHRIAWNWGQHNTETVLVSIDDENLCDLCGKIIDDWDDRHTAHEKECKREWSCQCDLKYHQECCPVCNEVLWPFFKPKEH